MTLLKNVLSCLAVAITTVGSCLAGDLVPTSLECEYAQNPLGVDLPAPRLFWKLASRTRGQRQTAYRILVASSPERLRLEEGDLWDSGKVSSEATIQIHYAGKPLRTCHSRFFGKSGYGTKTAKR